MKKSVGLSLIFLLLTACATAIRVNLQTFVKPGPLQVVLDCSISTFYKEDGTTEEGFSENYNIAVCEAFADEVRTFIGSNSPAEVLEPVTITLGGQYGRNYETTNVFIDKRDGRLDGKIRLPKSQGKTIPFNTLPQADLPYLIKDLSESNPYRSRLNDVKYRGESLGQNFYNEVSSLPVMTRFPLVQKTPILLINVNGQKLTDALQTVGTLKSVAQGVGTAVVSGLLSGGSVIGSSWTKSGSVVAVNAVMIDEDGQIVWNRISGGKLDSDLSKTAERIFGFIHRW